MVTLSSLYPKTAFFGIDQSNLMLEKAEKRLRFCGQHRVQLKLAPSKKPLPFDDDFFDRIYVESVLAIQIGEDLPQILKEIFRVLKPNGQLCMNETIWLRSFPIDKIKQINQLYISKFGIIQANDDFSYAENWRSLLNQIGFDVHSIQAMDQISEVPEFPIPFQLRFRSKVFTAIGKIKSKLNRRESKSWQTFENEIKAIHASQEKMMEGHLFLAKKKA